MSENRFPHLEKISENTHKSCTIKDTALPESEMMYLVDTDDKDIMLTCVEDGWDQTNIVLGKQHLPFLKQLVKDLEEVTK
ncbi:hypothetical protein Riggi_46 [Bacillus phage Riggi]|uniref:Uncharacterized protein n=1 Tax=Bacillus phage Riggi TaxID=2884426 RepID=U5Q034_9CAUD|nr:hypothetical protein Riggi_46 [Bacillus phage Riggi]AGY48208.1 hypothetical protein Riggi_46 [Bacillus phage Riggi]